MITHTHPVEEARAASYKLLKISSPAFKNGQSIPVKYTCDGRNTNPPLNIEAIPKAAKSLAIIVEDPDVVGGSWVHWVIWKIPVMHNIKEQHAIGAQGRNNFGRHRYDGPCASGGQHQYTFKVYALDDTLYLPVSSNKADLERTMSDHILAFGELTGTYERRSDPLYLLL